MFHTSPPNVMPRFLNWQRSRAIILPLLAALLAVLITLGVVNGTALAGGPLVVSLYDANGDPLNAYNLVVDSNSMSPSTYAPAVATVAVRFCNTGASALNNVVGYIGNYTTTVSFAPGIYPARNSATFTTSHPLYNSGNYDFRHVGGSLGAGDATRFIGAIPAGQCKVQYWHLEYPRCKNTAGAWQNPPCPTTATWGDSVKPDDDLWLNFDVWAAADGGYNDNQTWTMTMRNEISAMANKIKPNPDGAWFNTNTSIVPPGGVITSNGILYEFGNVNQGFDNNGDYVPDYNAWAQPVGDPSYDPSCFRLIRTTAILTVSRGSGLPDMIINATDKLYFTNLPSNNTGVRGNVRYTFQAIGGPCSIPMSPYQEVASGYDNEKFNGDYGTGIPPVQSSQPLVTLDKSGTPDPVDLGSIITYKMPFQNLGASDAGLTLNTGWGVNMPLVIEDTVPDGLEYIANSATYNLTYANNGVTIRFSTDSGATWSLTDPGTVQSTWPGSKVIIQWWLNDPLPKNTTGANNYAQFQARPPAGSTPPAYSSSYVENCAKASFGGGTPFAQACDITMIKGNNSIGDFVWRDLDVDFSQDGGSETGINGVKVSVYYDKNGSNTYDSGDVLISTQDTYNNGGSNDGYYKFDQLPDGKYIVIVDTADDSIPTGYYPTTYASPKTWYAADLDSGHASSSPIDVTNADFGFGPAVLFDKALASSNPAYEGDYVLYNIKVTNNRVGDGNPPGPCQYTVWASALDSTRSGAGNKAWTSNSRYRGSRLEPSA